MKAPFGAFLSLSLLASASLSFAAIPVNYDGHSSSSLQTRDIAAASNSVENNFRRPGINNESIEVDNISLTRRTRIPYRPLLSIIPGGHLASRAVAALNNIEIDPQVIQNILEQGEKLKEEKEQEAPLQLAAQTAEVTVDPEVTAETELTVKANIVAEAEVATSSEEIKIEEDKKEDSFQLNEAQTELIASARKLIIKAAQKEDRKKVREILKSLKLQDSTTLKLTNQDEKKLAELAGIISSEFKTNEDMLLLAELLKKVEIEKVEIADDETKKEKAKREIVRRYYPRKKFRAFQNHYYDTVACMDSRVETLSTLVKSTMETQNQIMQFMMMKMNQNPYASLIRMGGVFGQNQGQDAVETLMQAAPGIYGSQAMIPGMMRAGGNITINNNNYYGSSPGFFGQAQVNDPLNIGNGIYNFDSVSDYLGTLTPGQLMDYPAIRGQVQNGVSDAFNLRSPGSRQLLNGIPGQGAFFNMPGSVMPMGR